VVYGHFGTGNAQRNLKVVVEEPRKASQRMLILTRKPGESLYIGDSIKITIVELKGHQIRVGIDAPKDMRIYREEIYVQIIEENKKAAEAPAGLGVDLENLSAAWTNRQGAGAGDSGGGGGSSGNSDDDPPKPRLGGLSAFSTVKVKEREGSVKGESTPRASSGAPQPKDPEVVVRRKKPIKTDE